MQNRLLDFLNELDERDIKYVSWKNNHEIELSIEDTIVQAGSPLDGATLQECTTPEGSNYMVIAVRRKSGALELMPPPTTALTANDVIVVFGTRDQFSELESLTKSPSD